MDSAVMVSEKVYQEERIVGVGNCQSLHLQNYDNRNHRVHIHGSHIKCLIGISFFLQG